MVSFFFVPFWRGAVGVLWRSNVLFFGWWFSGGLKFSFLFLFILNLLSVKDVLHCMLLMASSIFSVMLGTKLQNHHMTSSHDGIMVSWTSSEIWLVWKSIGVLRSLLSHSYNMASHFSFRLLFYRLVGDLSVCCFGATASTGLYIWWSQPVEAVASSMNKR